MKLESPGELEKGFCPDSRDRGCVTLRGGGPTFLALLPFPTEDQRLRRGGTGCLSEEGSPFLERRSPNRIWQQCREGGRKPGWVWVLDGGKQPCLGLKLSHFWGKYLSPCFSPRHVNLSLNTCSVCSSFSDTNSQGGDSVKPPRVGGDRNKTTAPAQPSSLEP